MIFNHRERGEHREFTENNSEKTLRSLWYYPFIQSAMNILTKIILIAIVLNIAAIPLNAGIITVKQDGTGNYVTIQAGINAAVWNSGDTVLVWPGVYYENINFNGKHITVASLYITNPDKWFIYNTIIDGNHSGSCVTMNGGSDTLIINGFTIKNGKNNSGGGIYANNTTISIKNCNIEYNIATSGSGGGLLCNYTHAFLSGTTLRFNHAISAGGLLCNHYSNIIFDPFNKCNIYCNFGAPGTDYAKSYLSPAQTIIVDTFTISNPDNFFISSYDNQNYPVNDVFIQLDHGYLEPVDQDLYVNPLTGDDSNNGTGVNNPLKTVAFAYIKIKSDSLNPHNIFLSNGTYSPSTNSEKLPLGTRSFISLIGENRDSTILDADSLSDFFRGFAFNKRFLIENITLQNGKKGVYIENNDFVKFKNVLMKDGYSGPWTGFNLYYIDSLYLKNVIIENLKGRAVLGIGNWDETVKSFCVEDCIINGNHPSDDPINTGDEGGGIGITGDSDPPNSYFGKIINLQITNNIRIPDPLWGLGMTACFSADQYCKIDVANATIGHNTLRGTSGFGTTASSGSELNIYNSILFGDSLMELSLGYPSAVDDPSTCRVYYSNVEGGQAEVQNWNGINTLVWGPGNIDSDPLWDTTAAIPYSLPWNSPCVNAGTPMFEPGMQPPYIIEEDTVYKLITFDYDTIALPPTDLAGNPRIFDGRIDMGAYECQDTTTGSSKFKVQSTKLKVEVYPNPFYANTFISFDLDKNAEVQAVIYDMNGNQVKRLMDATLPEGQYNMTWGGDDDSGRKVQNGAYIVTILINGKLAGSEKVMKKGK